MSDRIETGVVQFGDDCPGVFIRGDNAGFYGGLLSSLLQRSDLSILDRGALESLSRLLTSSNVHHNPSDVQLLKPYEECKK